MPISLGNSVCVVCVDTLSQSGSNSGPRKHEVSNSEWIKCREVIRQEMKEWRRQRRDRKAIWRWARLPDCYSRPAGGFRGAQREGSSEAGTLEPVARRRHGHHRHCPREGLWTLPSPPPVTLYSLNRAVIGWTQKPAGPWERQDRPRCDTKHTGGLPTVTEHRRARVSSNSGTPDTWFLPPTWHRHLYSCLPKTALYPQIQYFSVLQQLSDTWPDF